MAKHEKARPTNRTGILLFCYFPFSVIFLRCSILEGNLTILDGGNDSQRVYIIACIPQLFAAALKFLFNDSRNAADGAACLLYKGAKSHGCLAVRKEIIDNEHSVLRIEVLLGYACNRNRTLVKDFTSAP